MADFEKIKQDIIADIRPNGVGEITGQVMQDVLLDMVGAQESVYNDVETAFRIVGGSIASLENRVAEHTQDIADANAHINEVENKADANTQDIAEVNLHIENIDDKVDANAQAIKDNASAITTLGGRVSANENRIEAITTEVVNQGEAISTLEGRVNNVEVNIEQLPIGIIEEHLEEIDSTLASHSEQIDNLQTDTAHNRSMILEAREDIDMLQSKASQADGQISELQNEVEELSDEISKIAEDVGLYYGIEWDTTVADTAKTRIGDTLLHKSLPVQSNMRGCLLDDDGNVVEYLPRQSWVGQTLDGSKGQVMVEIPEHYRKFEQNGTTRRCMISEYPLPGYHCVPKMYISAYEATLQRSTTTLASVMSEDADYRGGNNNADWDGTYRSLLGRPATVINRTSFRNYARKRKSSTTEWNCQDYNAYKAVFWLYMVEYANSNSQLAFNAEKDANGFAQGGLGNGVTTISSSNWSAYNSYYPFVPCGHTNSLGNASGEVAYEMLQEDGSVLSTVYANRYRGIENPFGHIWKWTDGINIQIEPDGTGDSSSKVYVADDTANYNDSNYDGYTMRGLEARAEGYVRELVFGEFGDIMPAEVGGGSTTYWADYHYTNIPEAEALRGVLFGGAAHVGANAGFAYAGSFSAPSGADADVGSRLCFIPEKK